MPSVRFLGASPSNYTVAHRPASAIRLIVIHVTESPAASAISWFRNPKAQASANYVVGQDGSITQMVRDTDIAWQAGNWAINRESIGIEHGGYTYRAGSFTEAEYRASARLVASELRHYLLPIDRRHVIGHSQVPDPNHAGLFGGFAHHTDPGPHWNWSRYMGYVTTYARGGAPAPQLVSAAPKRAAAKPSITTRVGKSHEVSVASAGLRDGQTVAGFVSWKANVDAKDVVRVEFLVDGRVRATGRSFTWDTTKEANGGHVLTLRVVTKKRDTVGQSVRVTVANTPFTVASASLGNGADVSRLVRWEAVPAGAGVDHVDFLVDGRLAGTEHDAPYLYDGDGRWDTTKVDDGAHTLTLRAVASDGRIAESTVTVLVSNASAKPKPKPAGASIVMTGFGDGAVLSGKVDWRAATTGPAPKRVEFRVDGRWRWSESSPPYVFGGDGNTWDTAKEKAGRHVVTVQAVTADGSVSDRQTFTVTIQSPWTRDSAPSATTMAVVSSVADGAALHGDVPWTAAVNGAAPARVDFYVDGMLRHTERSAPYEFGGWDTTKEANGPHTLVVRATADDGATATTTQTVHVANAAPTVTIAGQTPADGATVGGTVDWRVTTSGLRPDRVELYVDGTLRATASHYRWDTARETNGPHTLTARVVAGDRSDTRSLTVTVANAAQRTAIASSSVADGQTLAGVVAWKVATSGAAPDAVELYVDGTLRTIGTTYAWDTTREQDGAHTLLVKAYDGPLVASKTYAVSIRNAPLAVSAQSIADGATVSRTVTWTVTANADSVEFWVDGALRRTDTSGPFSYSWDTTREADGPHTLVAKARSGTRSASAAATVTVANAASVAVTQSILDGQTLSGTLTWSVTTTGPVAKVQFLVDGTSAGTFRAAPYGGSLDTRRLPNGTHSLAVRATATDGTVATASATVTVSN